MSGHIFDLDGTIIDSLGLWLAIDKEYMAAHNIKYKREYSDIIAHLKLDECAHYFKEVLGVNKSIEEIQQDWNKMSYDAYAHHLKAKSGALEYVRQIALNEPCIVATSCQKDCALAALQRFGILDLFVDVVTTIQVGANKESPIVYQVCAEKMNLDAKDCYVYEDVVGAAFCAQKAGFKVVGVYEEMWENDQALLKKVCTRYIQSFDELLEKEL